MPIGLVQVKSGNTSRNLLNEIRQIIYFCIEKKTSLKSMQLYNEFKKSCETEWIRYL